jgi:hypothetical protein
VVSYKVEVCFKPNHPGRQFINLPLHYLIISLLSIVISAKQGIYKTGGTDVLACEYLQGRPASRPLPFLVIQRISLMSI